MCGNKTRARRIDAEPITRRSKNVIPLIQDSDMVELLNQVLEKLKAMSDEEFAEVALEAAE